jgi:hypothetical protein
MTNLSTRFNTWRRRRHLQRVARWEHKRLKGKTRFVIRFALIWSGSMIIANGLWGYYFRGTVETPKLIYFLVAGPVLD